MASGQADGLRLERPILALGHVGIISSSVRVASKKFFQQGGECGLCQKNQRLRASDGFAAGTVE